MAEILVAQLLPLENPKKIKHHKIRNKNCVHAWCMFFNDFQEEKKRNDSFGGGGQICQKYVPSTCYIFPPEGTNILY